MNFTNILRNLTRGLHPGIAHVRREPPTTTVKFTARISDHVSFQDAQRLAVSMANHVPFPAKPVGFPKRIGKRWVFSLRVACWPHETAQVLIMLRSRVTDPRMHATVVVEG